MANKLDWTEIFEDANYLAILDMPPIPFTGEREELYVDITDEEINSIKDSNGMIKFMNVMRWCLPCTSVFVLFIGLNESSCCSAFQNCSSFPKIPNISRVISWKN